jgi:YVTN family beta-propeller protein
MRFFRFLLLALILTSPFLLTSCDDEDNKPKGEFEKGILVINEGNFQAADGSVSHISVSGQVTNDLFGSVNSGRALGDVVQSIGINGDEGFVVVNNSNKVEVVNINTFEAIHTIDGVKLPRYFTAFNGKGYLTEWVSYSDPGRVSVIDLSTHQVTKTVTVGFGAENIVGHGGKLYVSNNFANSISVIDPVAASVTKTIEVGNSPGSLILDSQNFLWVVCGGAFNKNDGRLVQINTTTDAVVKTIELSMNVSTKAAANKAKDKIYFYKNNSIYAVPTSATSVSVSNILLTENAAGSFYGIGVNAENDVIYVADPKAFAGSGVIYTYAADGTAKETFTVGVAPNGFLFR